MGGVTEELGPLGAQLEDLHHQRVVVVLATVVILIALGLVLMVVSAVMVFGARALIRGRTLAALGVNT